MKKITYNNKQYVLNDPQYPVEETVTDTDMNEIKEVVNYNANESENVKNALINITTPKSSNINVKDSSDLNAKINVYGISEQDGEPSPSNIVDIENVTGNIDITVCNKNFFDENNTNNFKYGVGDDFTTKNDDGTFKTIANFSLGRNKGTKIVGLKANTDYIVSLDIKNITSTATSKAAEVEIIENAEKISIVTQKDFKNLGINTLEFNSGSYQDLSLHISGYTYSEVSKSVSVTFADVLIAEKSNDNSYVEHKEQLITFPLQEGQKLYKGDYPADDGIHHVRKQVELDGTETQWIYYSANDVWARPYLTFTNKKIGESNNTANALCNKAKSISWEEMYQNIDEVSVFTYEGDNRISIAIKKEDLETQDVEGVKKYFQKNNMIVEYNLAKEEVEPYTPEQQEAYNKLQNVLSYYNVTNVFTDKALLVFKYIADTKTYIDNKYNSLAEQILEIVGGN